MPTKSHSCTWIFDIFFFTKFKYFFTISSNKKGLDSNKIIIFLLPLVARTFLLDHEIVVVYFIKTSIAIFAEFYFLFDFECYTPVLIFDICLKDESSFLIGKLSTRSFFVHLFKALGNRWIAKGLGPNYFFLQFFLQWFP